MPTHRFEPPALQGFAQQENADETPPKPASGSTNARQTRKLQLRNAGFRGAPVPIRKVTPNSTTSSNWSSISGVRGSSDVENVSPSATGRASQLDGRRESSGVLQDIGNSTLIHQPKKTRSYPTSNKASGNGVPHMRDDQPDLSTSPPPPKYTMRQRSVKSKPKVSHRRRSVSAETSKYIEHLETELAETQSQLTSINSSGATREQSSKMRTLNAETKQLQEELSAWESKYEQRVQEEVDRYLVIENDLRSRIRNLEQEGEEAKFRIQDLETQLGSTKEHMQLVEVANVNLEKRLEIMSELLANTKVDLHCETPGRARKHVRPKSMLPRFPTASSLMGSPTRQSHTQPVSPLFTHSAHDTNGPSSPIHNFSPLDDSPEHTDFMSEAESVFSEASTTGDSMTSVENLEAQPSFNPWNLPREKNPKLRPARRMRRFGAGSIGPKPLILPTTSHAGPYPPLTAPALEYSQTAPSFFPTQPPTLHDTVTSFAGRRRASTTPNEMTVAEVAVSPFAEIPESSFVEESLASMSTPPSLRSDKTTRRSLSVGAMIGRNLMDELNAARAAPAANSTAPSSESNQLVEDYMNLAMEGSSHGIVEGGVISPMAEVIEDVGRSESLDTGDGLPRSETPPPTHHRTRSRGLSIPIRCSQSVFTRLRILFGDLLRSPVTVARYLVQTAQARMSIPRPLLNVQWWLVGVLLGPMAKRRMLASSVWHEDVENQPLLLENTPDQGRGEDDRLAYSTFHSTSSPSFHGRKSSAAARSRKRASSKMHCTHRHNKHNPWLWIKFSITLAFAIGIAFKEGPAALLKSTACRCMRKANHEGGGSIQRERRTSPA